MPPSVKVTCSLRHLCVFLFAISHCLVFCFAAAEHCRDYFSSDFLSKVVDRLLCVDVSNRPSISEVARLISPLLLGELDRVNILVHDLRDELAHEVDTRRRHADETLKSRQAVR